MRCASRSMQACRTTSVVTGAGRRFAKTLGNMRRFTKRPKAQCPKARCPQGIPAAQRRRGVMLPASKVGHPDDRCKPGCEQHAQSSHELLVGAGRRPTRRGARLRLRFLGRDRAPTGRARRRSRSQCCRESSLLPATSAAAAFSPRRTARRWCLRYAWTCCA